MGNHQSSVDYTRKGSVIRIFNIVFVAGKNKLLGHYDDSVMSLKRDFKGRPPQHVQQKYHVTLLHH